CRGAGPSAPPDIPAAPSEGRRGATAATRSVSAPSAAAAAPPREAPRRERTPRRIGTSRQRIAALGDRLREANSPYRGRNRAGAHPSLPERPGGPRAEPRRDGCAYRHAEGPVGISRRGQGSGAGRVRAGHAAVALLAGRVRARSREAAMDRAPPL